MGTTDATAMARPVPPTDQAERVDVIKRAQEGDRKALPQMLAMFEEGGSRYVEIFGNMAAHVEKTLLTAAAAKNLAALEGLERKLAQLREELAGPSPTPIERLLAERAAFCWLTIYEYERHYANSGSITLKQAEYHQHRIDAAHRRFLSSLKTLATVRKLAIPAIQVNIGEKQVNVAKS